MDFREYAQGISFIEVKPLDPICMLEMSNVNLPEPTLGSLMLGMADLCSIPKMSTFAIAGLINKAVREMPMDQAFVNVGVWHGFTFLAGMLGNPDKTCIGIDNFSEFGGPKAEFRKRFMEAKSDNHSFFEMDYKWYFKNFHEEKPIGVYIYDGSHDYQNQLDGLKLAEPFLAEGAIVIVDDTNWTDPERATLDFMASSKFNYEVVLNEKTAGNGHPTWHNGIMVIKKLGRKDNA